MGPGGSESHRLCRTFAGMHSRVPNPNRRQSIVLADHETASLLPEFSVCPQNQPESRIRESESILSPESIHKMTELVLKLALGKPTPAHHHPNSLLYISNVFKWIRGE